MAHCHNHFVAKPLLLTIFENWKLIRRTSLILLPVRNLYHRRDQRSRQTGQTRREDWSRLLPATLRHSSSESTLPIWRVFCRVVTSLRKLLIDVWCAFCWTGSEAQNLVLCFVVYTCFVFYCISAVLRDKCWFCWRVM